MPTRPRPSAVSLTVDLVLVTPLERDLGVLVRRAPGAGGRAAWTLPWDAPRDRETLEAAASRLARAVLGRATARLEQVTTLGDRRAHPAGADVSVGYLGLVPLGAPAPVPGSGEPDELRWVPLRALPPLATRQRALVDAAVASLRSRVERAPVAFRLLPARFTLSELQEIYERLLGHPLHKASFRRALHAAQLVQATDEWRSEGRGRPAQLFRYAPAKRRPTRRGVRFELIGD